MNKGNYAERFIYKLLGSLIILPLVFTFWPSLIPFGLFELLEIKGTINQWLYSSAPLLIWSMIISVGNLIINSHKIKYNTRTKNPVSRLFNLSIKTGIVEEVFFRWWLFLSTIVVVKVINFLFFDFIGFGIPEWFHMNIVGPVANWVTLGALEEYIFHASGWAVGAAMISTNGLFRDGHKYQGAFGTVNSWFVGMFLFWLTFQYGLLSAIITHVLSNAIIYLTGITGKTLLRKQRAGI